MVTLTDTVGFIQDLPTQLIEAFRRHWKKSDDGFTAPCGGCKCADRLQHERTVQTLIKN